MGKKIFLAISSIVIFLTSIYIEPNYQTPEIRKGFPIALSSNPMFRANEGPVAADLNADGNLEIIMNSGNKMWAINSDGSIINGFPASIDHVMQHSPAVGDLDGDGNLEIIAQARDPATDSTFVYVFKNDGRTMQGFPVSFGRGFHHSPVLYNMKHNNKIYIVAGFEDKIYLLDSAGNIQPGWPYKVVGRVGAKPAVGDVNGNGQNEIIVTTYQKDRISFIESGELYALSKNAIPLAGFPVSADSLYGYNWADPVTVDFDEDGSFEIVVVMRNSSITKKSITVIYDGSGNVRNRWSTGYLGRKLSLGDFDGDAIPEVITWSHRKIYMNSVLGNEFEGWPVELGTYWSEYEGAVGNIDSVNGLELIYGSASTQYNYGWLSGQNQNGKQLLWSPLRPKGHQLSVPLLTDLDNDGEVDIVISTNSNNTNEMSIYAYEVSGSNYNPEELPWPMYGHDRYHTGQYGFIPND